MEFTKEQLEQLRADLNRVNFMTTLNTAIRQMRLSNQAPIKEGNPTDDDNYLVKVEFPEEGGVLSYYSKYKYPVQGLFYYETVNKLDITKKIFTLWFGEIDNLFKKHKIQTLLGLLFFRRQLKTIVSGLLNYAFWLLSPERLKPDKYCKCVREIYRTFTKINTEKDKIIDKIRDIICVFLEFDDAYRYRVQHAFSQFKIKDRNNEPLYNNFIWFPTPYPVMPIAKSDTDIVFEELNRILDILYKNEKYEHMKMRWRVVKRLLKFSTFSFKIQETITQFFLELNPDEIKLSEGDKYFASLKPSYMLS